MARPTPKVPGLFTGLKITLGISSRRCSRSGASRRSSRRPRTAPSRCSTPTRTGGARHPGPGRHRAEVGELHGLHAVLAQLPRLVHLHRGPQDEGPAPPARRQGAHRQRPRPLRHRLRAVHVLRHLRGGVPVRRPVLEPRVRVLRAPAGRPAPRRGPPQRVDGDRARLRALRGGLAMPRSARCRADGRPEPLLLRHRGRDRVRRDPGGDDARTSCTPRCTSSPCSPAWPPSTSLLAAEFVAATQVLVYIGAIVVLFLFGIMLTRAKIGRDQDLTHKHWWSGAATAVAAVRASWPTPSSTSTAGRGRRCRPTRASLRSTAPTPPR